MSVVVPDDTLRLCMVFNALSYFHEAAHFELKKRGPLQEGGATPKERTQELEVLDSIDGASKQLVTKNSAGHDFVRL